MSDLITTITAVISTLIALVTINPLYDLSLDINIINPKLSLNEDLNVSVFLQKMNLTKRSEIIEVKLDYEILKSRSIVVNGSFGSILVNDSFKDNFIINTSNLTAGRHTIKVEATHPQSNTGQDSEKFSKTSKSSKSTNPFANILDAISSLFGF